VFQPFVADALGALRADARHFIQRLIQRKKQKTDECEASRFAAALWAALSEAAVSRAAIQIAHAATEMREDTSDLFASASLPSNMGILPPLQPSSSALTLISASTSSNVPRDVVPIDKDSESVPLPKLHPFPYQTLSHIPPPGPGNSSIMPLPLEPPTGSGIWEDDFLDT